MVKTLVMALCVFALLASLPAPAAAGNMRQSPLLRKNRKTLCPNGKFMHAVRTGRTVLATCS